MHTHLCRSASHTWGVASMQDGHHLTGRGGLGSDMRKIIRLAIRKLPDARNLAKGMLSLFGKRQDDIAVVTLAVDALLHAYAMRRLPERVDRRGDGVIGGHSPNP